MYLLNNSSLCHPGRAPQTHFSIARVRNWLNTCLRAKGKAGQENMHVEHNALMGTPLPFCSVLSRVLFHSSRTIRCSSFIKMNSSQPHPWICKYAQICFIFFFNCKSRERSRYPYVEHSPAQGTAPTTSTGQRTTQADLDVRQEEIVR